MRNLLLEMLHGFLGPTAKNERKELKEEKEGKWEGRKEERKQDFKFYPSYLMSRIWIHPDVICLEIFIQLCLLLCQNQGNLNLTLTMPEYTWREAGKARGKPDLWLAHPAVLMCADGERPVVKSDALSSLRYLFKLLPLAFDMYIAI